MKTIRRVLYPFSLLYAAVTGVRNFFYDKGIFKSTAFSLPVIAVGNLSVGGTGKTPQIEYLIRLLSNHNLKLATISRGYKRKTKGMVVATPMHTAADLGDEPFQFYSKFKDLTVIANGNRVEAIQYLLEQPKCPDVVLLDDAMQHRKVKAGFYVMLTAYQDFFYSDLVLPAGNLRESKCGAKRANCIVVTKCPSDLTNIEAERIKNRIKKYAPQIPVYFSAIAYYTYIYNQKDQQLLSDLKADYVLLAGIAKPEPFFKHLKKENTLLLRYPDHHNFTTQDIEDIKQKASGKLIITTEKDYVRLVGKIPQNQLYYLPIQATFLFDESEAFNQQILRYVMPSI
ncbi:tetraacyldisaccharide 4'-kinase [Flavobacterium agricola]|uniref:Tetraacyldisaccharide 4'-kinase n=1 Tax=Flavobacterium agricola TaxID=2870839 RepID=A0ABY6LZM6_9FLAO|nr:tetraacyldisaccharide 4'-kinase [Flavobacterium agricola]UYW01651.1 tetraacyldisaccharide 4'-kinase [Flavobacterium agricola]